MLMRNRGKGRAEQGKAGQIGRPQDRDTGRRTRRDKGGQKQDPG